MKLVDIMLSEQTIESRENDELKDYALLTDTGRHSTDFVLYKPKYYAQRMKELIDKAKEQYKNIIFKGEKFDNFKDFFAFSNVQDIFSDPRGIYAFMSLNNGRMLGLHGTCYGANEIRKVAARSGHGKLIFNIALAKDSPIMANREETSQGTQRELEKFSVNPLLVKNDFDDETRLHNKSEKDCAVYSDPILDRSYGTKVEQKYQIQPLLNRHEIFMKQMKSFFEKNKIDYIASRAKEYLADGGYLFFLQKKGESVWYQNISND